MSFLTLDEYKELCWIEWTEQDLILGKFLNAGINQIKCAIWEDPCKKDKDENYIEKIHKTSSWRYDHENCYYEIFAPIPICQVLTIQCQNHKSYCYTFDEQCIKIKAQEWCLEDKFWDVCIHYYWWRDNLDDLCLLVKLMTDVNNPSKTWSQVSSVKMWCESISLCCPKTNLYDDLITGIQCKYFSSDVTCVW